MTIAEELQGGFDDLVEDIGTETISTIGAITDEDGVAVTDESDEAVDSETTETILGLPATQSDSYAFAEGGPRDRRLKTYRVKSSGNIAEGQRVTVDGVSATITQIDPEPNGIFSVVSVRFHE